MTIYLCRHGQTEFTESQRLMGQIDTPLTQAGVLSAEKIADFFENIKLPTVYSSDLGRAIHSAHIIREKQSDTPKLIITDRLRTIDYGDYIGRTKKEVADKVPEYKSDIDFVYPGAEESLRQLRQRILDCLNGLLADAEGNLLIVSHGSVMRAILCHYLKLDFEDNLDMDIPYNYIGQLNFKDKEFEKYKKILL